MAIECENLEKNLEHCACSYTACDRRGKCCACIQHHLANKQLPGCCFPEDAEKTYDRSFKKFIEVWSARV